MAVAVFFVALMCAAILFAFAACVDPLTGRLNWPVRAERPSTASGAAGDHETVDGMDMFVPEHGVESTLL
jgi:hypothetical protein